MYIYNCTETKKIRLMQDNNKSKEELIEELNSLREQVTSLQEEKKISKLEKIHLNIYKKIFLTTNDHFSIISPDYKYIEVNNSYLLAHGITRENIVNRKISDVFGAETFNNFIKKNLDACKSGQNVRYNKWFEFPIGKKKFMQVSYHPCFVNNEIRGIIVNSHDITNLKEKELLLEKTNLEKDKLFSIIAHDLRSPFSGIIGFAELLIQNPEEYTNEKYIEIIKIINSLAENTLVLLENLLEWANFQQNRTPFAVKKLNLSKLINKELPNLKNAALLKGIEIKNLIDENINVWADENMLKIICRNLINNALKFTNKGGLVELNAEEKNYSIKISIKDSGIGIEKEKLQKIFIIDKEKTTLGTENEKGTGLGLILCKEFIEKHGGEIGVDSQPQKGSVFHFTLPNKK